MVINPRSMAGLAAIWVLAIAGVSATAWFAIDRAGRDLTSASMSSLTTPPMPTPTPDQPAQTEPAPPPTSTPAPSVAPPPPPSTPTPASPRGSGRPSEQSRASTPPKTPTAQVRSVTVPGGQVTVRCVGTQIRLQVAQPENDWRVRVETRSGRIVVTFRFGGDEEESQRTEVAAVCQRGIPDFHVSHR